MEKMMGAEGEEDRYLELEICTPWLLTKHISQGRRRNSEKNYNFIDNFNCGSKVRYMGLYRK